jgi:urea transport system substrate-binding protein
MSRHIPTRRDILKTAGRAGLALAASQPWCQFVFSGDRAPEIGSIKVGILHSLTGILGKNESALKDAELMAIDEINAKGGVLRKRVEAVIEDPASNFVQGFPEKASKLLREDKVAAVFGCWTSALRAEQRLALLPHPVRG